MKSFAATLLPGVALTELTRGLSLAGVAKAFTIARERRDLAGLDPHMLNDIGMNPEDAAHEANRGFWDIPANR